MYINKHTRMTVSMTNGDGSRILVKKEDMIEATVRDGMKKS